MAEVILTPARIKRSYILPAGTWEEGLRPTEGISSATGQRHAGFYMPNFGTPTYNNLQVFIEFDTSEYNGITTNLTLTANTIDPEITDLDIIDYLIFIAGINLYPETDLVYWPEVIKGDFDSYQQENIPFDSAMVHNYPGQVTLGDTVRFCLGSWNVITEIAPDVNPPFSLNWQGTNFTELITDYKLIFEAAETTSGNVLFNAFSL